MHSHTPNYDYTELSREISYALRHAPEKYGLELDEEGWTSLDGLLSALRKRQTYQGLTVGDIADMIERSEKKRHELANGRIRALYGHSTKARIQKEPELPPEVLYHGTVKRFLASIQEQGLRPMKRQYVHLTEDIQMAEQVAMRREDMPVLLCIDAAAAWNAGIRFYHGNEKVWLAEPIPARYISVKDWDETP